MSKPPRKELYATIDDLQDEIDDLQDDIAELIEENVALQNQVFTLVNDQWSELAEAVYDRDRFYQDYLSACQTIALMHAAATGVRGAAPVRGVVEDVEDVRIERDKYRELAQQATNLNVSATVAGVMTPIRFHRIDL